MLNISGNSIKEFVRNADYRSLDKAESRKSGRVLVRLLTTFFIIFLIIMFLPWTQNILARGSVTTLRPDQRPQTVHSVIAGRIETWYVREGDMVEKGDTILFLSEIKDDYFDPQLLDRTQQQVTSKQSAVLAYREKVTALETQIAALRRTSDLKQEQAQNKLRQAKLKVLGDSIDFEAAKVNVEIARTQEARARNLYEQDLKSLTEVENRELKTQEANAKVISAENKLLASQNEVLNARVELTSIDAQYRDDIAKAESEKFTALSAMYDAEATATKLENQYSNYSVRTSNYYVTAPQAGYVIKTIQSGIGETVKEGDQILKIMPAQYDLSVEMYVKPIDLPLLSVGEKVRVQFDGWPAIVFNGWPNASFGTFGGEVFAVDNYISPNGMYRVLIAPDPEDKAWPEPLRAGAGARAIVLLRDVPIWYELWRKINGFPPDYYTPVELQAPPTDAKR